MIGENKGSRKLLCRSGPAGDARIEEALFLLRVWLMSVVGTKRTWASALQMSALGVKRRGRVAMSANVGRICAN